jgi:lysophospholipase L1-like esterase
MYFLTSRFRFIFILLITLLLTGGILFTSNMVQRPVAAQDAIRVMPLGDSITAGIGASDKGGYRVKLWQDCLQAGWHVSFVGSQKDGPRSLADRDHEGHPGWRIRQLSEHINGWLHTYQPQIILLQIGTNDIVFHDRVASAPDRLRALLLQISGILPRTTIIVAQITPLRNPTLDEQVKTYNRAIPGIVQELAALGKAISYVDMYHTVSMSDLDDGVHPDDSGYRKMATAWYMALQKIM